MMQTQIPSGLQALMQASQVLQQQSSPTAPGPGGQPQPTVANRLNQALQQKAQQDMSQQRLGSFGIAPGLNAAEHQAGIAGQIQAQQAQQAQQQAQNPQAVAAMAAQMLQRPQSPGILGQSNIQPFKEGGIIGFDGEDGKSKVEKPKTLSDAAAKVWHDNPELQTALGIAGANTIMAGGYAAKEAGLLDKAANAGRAVVNAVRPGLSAAGNVARTAAGTALSLPAAGIATVGVPASHIATGVLNAHPEIQDAYLNNPLLGAMDPNGAFASGILSGGQTTQQKAAAAAAKPPAPAPAANTNTQAPAPAAPPPTDTSDIKPLTDEQKAVGMIQVPMPQNFARTKPMAEPTMPTLTSITEEARRLHPDTELKKHIENLNKLGLDKETQMRAQDDLNQRSIDALRASEAKRQALMEKMRSQDQLHRVASFFDDLQHRGNSFYRVEDAINAREQHGILAGQTNEMAIIKFKEAQQLRELGYIDAAIQREKEGYALRQAHEKLVADTVGQGATLAAHTYTAKENAFSKAQELISLENRAYAEMVAKAQADNARLKQQAIIAGNTKGDAQLAVAGAKITEAMKARDRFTEDNKRIALYTPEMIAKNPAFGEEKQNYANQLKLHDENIAAAMVHRDRLAVKLGYMDSMPKQTTTKLPPPPPNAVRELPKKKD